MRVLVLEDDQDIGSAVARFLREAGYAVDLAIDLAAAEERLAVNDYDVLVFDRHVPDGDSIHLLRAEREAGRSTPTLFLTALDGVVDRVDGLAAGADDYLIKPFAMEELVARVHALSRRSAQHTVGPATVLRLADVALEPDRLVATRNGEPLNLTIKEFAVLRYLLSNPNRVVTRTELIEHCWDEFAEPMSNVVDVKVAQLRKKLGDPPVLHTVRGAGYSLSKAAP